MSKKLIIVGIVLFVMLFTVLPAKEEIQSPCDDPSCVGVHTQWEWLGGIRIMLAAFEGNGPYHMEYLESILSTVGGTLVLSGIIIFLLSRKQRRGSEGPDRGIEV